MNETESYQPSKQSTILTTLVLLSMTSVYLLILRPSVLRNNAGVEASGALPREMHTANIPYFVESEDLKSTLVLNNNKPDQTAVIVTIYNTKGEALQLAAINLKPLIPTRLSLQELLKSAKGNFSAGNIRVLYDGSSMSVTTQVSVVSADKKVSFESVEATAEDFATSRLDGILWVPDDETQVGAGLTNASSSPIDVAIKTDREQSNLSLLPRETRVVDLRALVMNVVEDSGGVLVTMEHNGTPGALIATGFALNKKTGFSSNLNFADCEASRSTKLAAAHVRLGSVDPHEGFKRGTTFRSPLAIANTMDKPTEARISVDYTTGGQPRQVQLKPVTLAPREVKLIELSKQMARKGITREVDDAGVDITYDGMPGTVIGRLTSFTDSGNYSFDVPVKDPVGQGNGSYPWRLDNGYTTVVHLKNTLDKNVTAVLQVRYEGGSYNPDRIKLAPHQTVAIDIGQLRDAQKKDLRGGVMPKKVESGQVAWFEEEPESLIGRAEVSDITNGLASSFSCGECGCSGLVMNSCAMTPSSGTAEVGAFGYMFAPSEMRRDCNYVMYGPYSPPGTITWSSTNTPVVTVDGAGNETTIAPGSANILAQWQTIVGYNYACAAIYANVTANATCDVQCLLPTGETSNSDGWDSSTPTIHRWNQTLTGSGNFVGREIAENDGTGGSDNCDWPGSEIPKAHLSGGGWTVETGNTWKPDLVGYTPDAINYYRANGRAPCQAIVPQDMYISCPDILHKYTSGNLVYGITATQISIKRHSAATQTKIWP
jgi:hypothetical protein